jgi:hypothetical protein
VRKERQEKPFLIFARLAAFAVQISLWFRYASKNIGLPFGKLRTSLDQRLVTTQNLGERMSKIFNGRYTAKTDEPFVVFLIGMRINKLWRVDKWLPVANAMTPMLMTLFKHPEKGFLHGEFFLNFGGPVLIQYWRSFEDLENFARNPSDPHLEAWKKFNKAVGADGSVGIWHETYKVEPNSYECVYGNMPAFGLGAAMEHVEAVGRRETARLRLSANRS